MKPETLISETINLPSVITISPAALTERDAILRDARTLLTGPIQTREQADAVGRLGREMQTLVKETREAGLSLRSPLTAKAKEVIRVEDSYCDQIEKEIKRLSAALTERTENEAKRVAAETAAREAEIARREAAVRELERKAQEEAKRLQSEIEAARAKANEASKGVQTEEEMNAAIAEETRLKNEAQEKQMDLIADATRARIECEEAKRTAMLAPIPEAHKVAGTSGRRVVSYVITDATKLYNSRPYLFDPPEPKKGAIKSVCVPRTDATKENPQVFEDGISAWWENETTIRRS